MKLELSLKNLSDLDMGKVDAAFRREVGRVLADIADRPEDSTARTVQLQLALTPVGKDGDIAAGEFTLMSKVPPRRTRPYEFGIRQMKGQHTAVFNSESLDDVRQGTLDEAREEKP